MLAPVCYFSLYWRVHHPMCHVMGWRSSLTSITSCFSLLQACHNCVENGVLCMLTSWRLPVAPDNGLTCQGCKTILFFPVWFQVWRRFTPPMKWSVRVWSRSIIPSIVVWCHFYDCSDGGNQTAAFNLLNPHFWGFRMLWFGDLGDGADWEKMSVLSVQWLTLAFGLFFNDMFANHC